MTLCSTDPSLHVILTLALSFLCQSVFAQGRTDTIAATGQSAPDGNGVFSEFFAPVLNDSGQTAFAASLIGTSGAGTDDTGIFRGSGGTITQIAREGQAAPDGNGTYSGFSSSPVLNDLGQTAFAALLTGTSGGATDNQGIFRGNGGTITQISRLGQSAPDNNGTYVFFSLPLLNNSGQVAFYARLGGTSGGSIDNQGIFRGNGGTITQIARDGQAAPNNGLFSDVYSPALNDLGQVAFGASLTGTSGGSADNRGIFLGSGGTIMQIVRKGQTAPDANGTFSSFGQPALNNSGQTAFHSILSGTSGGIADNGGIFRGSGGAITQIARAGQSVPDANGVYSGFRNPVLNNSGQVAFFAGLTGTSGGSFDDRGIFRGSGGAITQIVRSGQSTPDGNGVFSNFHFDHPDLNDSGQTAFWAELTGTSGGTSDDSGIFTGDGIDLLKVVRKGDFLAGSTVTNIRFSATALLNSHGQIAYQASLANGQQIINRWTPDLHWRSTLSGDWVDQSKWTLGLAPAHVHDVFINPANDVTVTGPTSSFSVNSLEIGNGAGQATLLLQNSATLSSNETVVIQGNGLLTGKGVIGNNLVNVGTVQADDIMVTGTLTNIGLMHGSGRIHADIVNNVGAEIVSHSGMELLLSGPGLVNHGLISVNQALLRSEALLVNETGMVSIAQGNLVVDGGIVNKANMFIDSDLSTIRASVDNRMGDIRVGIGARAFFEGDLIQNGGLEILKGAASGVAVVGGVYSGFGGTTGGGDLFLMGDLSPGDTSLANSAAALEFEGNLLLDPATRSLIELGDLQTDQFDRLLITGDFVVAGDLHVTLFAGHTLSANDFYLIGDVEGSLFGQFNGLGEGSLVGNFGGRDLFITYVGGNGNDIGLFTAVPEPSGPVAALQAILIFLIRARRRRMVVRHMNPVT